MVVEAVQNYVTLVNGLTRTTREKAFATARAMLAQAGLDDVANDAQERVTKLAEEILLASKANRELLDNLIATEVDRAASRLGFVRSDEVDELRREVADLKVAMAYESAAAAAARAAQTKAAEAPAPSTPVKKAAAAKRATPATRAPSARKTSPTTSAATTKTATKKTATTKAAATKAAATKTAARKTTARKTTAKKTTARTTTA